MRQKWGLLPLAFAHLLRKTSTGRSAVRFSYLALSLERYFHASSSTAA